jgi:hypothetical protein
MESTLTSKDLKEEDLATIASLYLESKGWDVFPEVAIPIFGGRPDMVGVKGSLCAAIETKKSLNYPVIEQLTRWHDEYQETKESTYKNESIKGIPHLLVAVISGKYAPSRLKDNLIKSYKLGVWGVFSTYETRPCTNSEGEVIYKGQTWKVVETIEAKIQPGSRTSAKNIIAHLNNDMKMGKAGTTGVKDAYMTPFKRTMAAVWQYLSLHDPGTSIHLTHIVNYLNKNGGHHYTSDSGAIASISNAFVRENMSVEYRRIKVPKILPNGLKPSADNPPKQDFESQ